MKKQLTIRVQAVAVITVDSETKVNLDDIPMKLEVFDLYTDETGTIDLEVNETDVLEKQIVTEVAINE